MIDMKLRIGNKLSTIREDRKMTQIEMAELRLRLGFLMILILKKLEHFILIFWVMILLFMIKQVSLMI